MTTVQDVAQWMFEEVNRHGILEHETAASEIRDRFGEECTYENESGTLAISRTVLGKFRERTEDAFVWERSSRQWVKRETYHFLKRRQDS